MSRTKYLLPCQPQAGYTEILKLGRQGMKLTGFGLLRLQPGETWDVGGAKCETALVVLGGKCAVSGKGFDFPAVGERENVFAGLPYTVYLPAGCRGQIRALTAVEIAVSVSPAGRPGTAMLIPPAEVKQVTIGRDNFTREAFIMLDERTPAEHLFIGEARVPSGNWASYPPHRHDVDNPPAEIDMEELYFFRFNPAGGFGVQKIYTDDRELDEAYTVRENDTVAIPRGYHPVVNAPGYTMYYLWIMAGANHRGFISAKDPRHEWVK